MTVSTTTNTVIYRGNGSATEFAVPFLVLDDEHLIVQRRVFATGVIDTTYTTGDYSYAGVGEDAGTLTLTAATLSSSYEIIISRVVPYRQDMNISGAFHPEVVEDTLDLIVMQIQQVAEESGRAVKVAKGETIENLDSAAARVGKYLGFDADGEISLLSGSGTDSAFRDDVSEADGTDLIGLPGGGALSNAFLNIRYASQFASLELAVTDWVTRGGILVITEDYTLTSPIVKTLLANTDYVLQAQGRRTITYAGSATDYLFEFLTVLNTSVTVIGDFIFDGANLVAQAFRVQNDTDNRSRQARFYKTEGKNCQATALLNGGTASGLVVHGNFQKVIFEECLAQNISRTVSAGNCQGLVAARTTYTRGPKVVIMRDCGVTSITVPTVLTDESADGIDVFQNFEDGAFCFINGFRSFNSQGRAIKAQTGHVPTFIQNVNIYRNIQACKGGVSGTKEIDCQFGSGYISNVVVEFEGATVHDNSAVEPEYSATTVISVNHPGTNVNGELDNGIGGVKISNVTVYDRSTNGDTFDLFSFYTTSALETDANLIEISNVKVQDGLVRTGIHLGSAGQSKPVTLIINGLTATFLDQGTAPDGGRLILASGNLFYLTATVSNLRNLGADELCVTNLEAFDVNYGQWIDGGGNINVKLDRGELAPVKAGLRRGRQGNITSSSLYPSYYSLPMFDEVKEVRTGETVSFGPYGDGTYKVWVKLRDAAGTAYAVGEYNITLNTAAIAQVTAAGGIDLGSNDGTVPTLSGSEVGLYHDITDDVIKFKANGTNFLVTVIVLGG